MKSYSCNQWRLYRKVKQEDRSFCAQNSLWRIKTYHEDGDTLLMPNFARNSELSDITPEIVVDKLGPRCRNVIYRDDPPQEVFMQLLRTAYASELWSLAETDLCLWKAAFGEKFRMLVAYDEASSYPVGCICAVTYNHRRRDTKTTVIGLFYVRKQFRGKGIGNELFRRIIAKEKDHNLYLNGSFDMVEKYQMRDGFVFATPWRAVWHQINPKDVPAAIKSSECEEAATILGVTASTLHLMLEYDRSIQDDLDRSTYIQLFAMQPCADAKLAVCDGETVGMGIARLLYNDELFIGPLYANTYEIARALMHNLLNGKHRGHYRNIQMQIPSVNEMGKRLVEEFSQGRYMTDDYTQGLATKFRIEVDPDRIYSTTEYDFSVA